MPKRKGGLGKGLEDLLGAVEINVDELVNASENRNDDLGIKFIDINNIKPNINQPRKKFNEEKIEELATSIKEHGLIQPIVVRKSKSGYEIVAGERRWRAARKAALKTVPCILKKLDDKENMLLAIIENMQREDLNPIEEAEGLNQMIDIYGLTQEEVAKSIGKSRPYVSNILRLLRLDDEIKSFITDKKLTYGHAKALAAIKDKEKRISISKNAVDEGMSVRELEKLVKNENKYKGRPAKRSSKSPEVIKVEKDLSKILGTKVDISGGSANGNIKIEYYGVDELNRIIDILKG